MVSTAAILPSQVATSFRAWSPGAGVPARRGRKSSPRLQDRQIQVLRRRGQNLRVGAVAVGRAVGGPFERGDVDVRGRLPLDQFLIQRLGRDPNPVDDIGEFQLSK
jgi:hypothetical protein